MLRARPFPVGGIVEASDEGRDLGETVGREVAALFEAENRRRGGAMFDGLLFSVEQFGEDHVVGGFVRYSRFVAQLARPELFEALRVRPMGVSGVATCADGLVFGRRREDLTLDAGLWELVPSGSIDSSCRDGGGRIDAVAQILDELGEEVGIGRECVASAVPFILVENVENHVTEAVIAITLSLTGEEVRRRFDEGGSGEYTEVAVVPERDVRSFVEARDGQMVAVSCWLLREKGLL